MRITSANAFEQSIANLQKRQQDMSTAQARLTSGKRVAVASDDPVAAARAERALAALVRSEAKQRALEASRNVMQQAETALGDAGELLQQARETMVNAGNGSYDDSDRRTLAEALKGIRTQLLGVANRVDGGGTYIFGGQGSDSPPFVDAPGGVIFRGVGGVARTATDENLPLAVDGRDAWLRAPDPRDGAADLSVFDVLDRLVAELEAPGRERADIQAGVSAGIADLDALSGHVLARRASAGEMLNRADALETRIGDERLAAQTERSNAEDLDMVQAISEFENNQTSYDAALKSYATVQRLSLFQYLSA